MKLIVHAPNIHTGGGRTLLLSLIEAISNKYKGHLIIDERLSFDFTIPNSYTINRISPSIKSRIYAERLLKSITNPDDVVLCFGNLPPIFQLKGRVSVFLQNRYIVENIPLSGFDLVIRVRILMERFWLSFRKNTAEQYIVQTTSMQRFVQKRLSVPTVVRPFMPDIQTYRRGVEKKNRNHHVIYDFIYVASGEPHKNHYHLVRAWIHLAMEGIRPSLVLTLNKSKFPQLYDWIEGVTSQHKINIINKDEMKRTDILNLYNNCRALIFPSLIETIGLPLIEARVCGLTILASELDYIRDIVDPEYTFNPNSAVSIARAVKRFLGVREKALSLMDAPTFIDNLIQKS